MITRTLAASMVLSLALSAPAAAQVMDLRRDFEARGAKPNWTLSLRGNRFILRRPGKPDVVATAPGAAIAPPRATWSAKTAAGKAIAVTFVFNGCVIGATQYPISVEVDLDTEKLSGCAAAVGQRGPS